MALFIITWDQPPGDRMDAQLEEDNAIGDT